MFFLKNIHFFQLSFATFEQPYLFDSVATQLHARGKKNVLLGVARTSNTQVAAMLREKSFFQKHNKSLVGDKFTEDMTEIIQARKQSI